MPEVERRWKKIGGGSLRWNGQIIKANQIFWAKESELPASFRNELMQLPDPANYVPRGKAAPPELKVDMGRIKEFFRTIKAPPVVYVIGGGSSLTNMDLSPLEGKFVIAVNRAYSLFPSAAIHFFADDSFFREHRLGIVASPIPLRVSVAKTLLNEMNILVLNKAPKTSGKQTPLVSEIGTLSNTNSGLMAANLAFQMGAKLVVLLGMDLREINRRKHWHTGYSHPSIPKSCEQMLEEWEGARYYAWKSFRGDMVHGTPGSALAEVDYWPLEDILKEIETKTYYGGWWMPKEEEHFRMMLHKSKPHLKRLTYQYWNKMSIAMGLLPEEKRKGIAIDVGSNLGFWSYPLSQVFSEVHCFEPSPLFQECWAMNHAGIPNAILHPFGIAKKSGELSFSSPLTSCGGTHVGAERGENVFSAKVRRLDSFNLSNVSFLKVDCEGYELPVLESGIKMLKREKPLVIVEQKTEWEHRFPFPPKGAVEFLKSLGAKVYKEIYGDYIMGWGE